MNNDVNLNQECGNCGDMLYDHAIMLRHLEIDFDVDLKCGSWETALNPEPKEKLPPHPDKIYVWDYTHGDNEEFSEWEMWLDENTTWDKHGSASHQLHYRLYEVSFFLEIDLNTGANRVMIVKYGGQTFYSDDYDETTMKEFDYDV